ncbi:UvrD-helicase domain-containing protein [Anaplasmataceae bacterium AB001_6]|nr:UvrD-helicase domain-containing protein [Anaplasmataceae bacterium AB001_6]
MHTDLIEIQGLNKKQLEAVKKISGPLLILAGAGTGKTKTIVSKILFLIQEKKINPNNILSVTFTNKAANEMKNRITSFLGSDIRMEWVGTFHSIAVKILRYDGDKIGLSKDFSIIDEADKLKILSKICKENCFDCDKQEIKKISSIIQNWKNDCITPESYALEKIASNNIVALAKTCYVSYQAKLKKMNNLDFGDLLMLFVLLLETNEEVKEKYCSMFKYIMVDEYQDTNNIQYNMLKILSSKHKNICCVGDDDQSIYGWRGAKIQNILNFDKYFSKAEIIKLEQNYRSTSSILNLSYAIISKNHNRHQKKLWTTNETNNKIKMFIFENGKDEAYHIIRSIKMLNYETNAQYSTAILVRSGFQTRNLEESCTRHGVKYKILGGLKFYDRKEIKDIIAYLKLTLNHNDDLSFERVVNTPKRSVGSSTIEKINMHAMHSQESLFNIAKKKLLDGTIKNLKLEKFLNDIEKWKFLVDKKAKNSEILETIFHESGYWDMITEELENEIKVENLKEMKAVVDDFSSINEFLEHIGLISDIETSEDDNSIISIITMHSAKGLEFDNIYIPCWEENIFPNPRSINHFETLEEERRIAYVAVTRAKRQLIISRAKSRTTFNQRQYNDESRFTKHIDNETIERTSDITKLYQS